MDATTSEEVGSWLSERRFHVISISESSLGSVVALQRRPTSLTPKEMNYFLHQLSSLLNAGCPLVSCLRALHRQLSPGNLKTLLWEIKEKIEMGKSFSETLKHYPDIFPNLFITMVEVGEIGGILDEVLEKYAQIYDSLFRIRSKIIKSLIYPALLFSMTILVAWALLVWVFPVFIEQVESRGGVLPTPTRIVLFLSQILTTGTAIFFAPPRALPFPAVFSYPVFLGIFGVLAWKVFSMIWNHQGFRQVFDRFTLASPLIGALIHHAELALFTRTLGTLIKCGVPILTSLTAVEKAQGNQKFKQALEEIRAGVSKGESLSLGMSRRRDLFPESLILMADVGERGGNVGALMEKAADFYERDLETTIEAVISLLEPLLVVFLAVFVVVLALAMYMPLFDIIKMVR